MRHINVLILIALLSIATDATAEENEKEYAKAALNGLKMNRYAEHVSAPFEMYFNFDYGKSYTQSILDFKPVVPFRLTDDYDLIIRTIFPLYERTPTQDAQHDFNGYYVNGWGDLNPTFFITPARFDHLIVGLGPSLSIPTSTNSQYIGTGKWSIGPELAIYYLLDNWMVGSLIDNLWSFAGDAQRPSVNTFQFQYLVSYVFDSGWYVATNPSITANWNSPGNEQWTVPFGVGGGRVVKFGQQPLNIAMYGYYNAVRPAGTGPNWQVELQMEWLFNSFTIPGSAKV